MTLYCGFKLCLHLNLKQRPLNGGNQVAKRVFAQLKDESNDNDHLSYWSLHQLGLWLFICFLSPLYRSMMTCRTRNTVVLNNLRRCFLSKLSTRSFDCSRRSSLGNNWKALRLQKIALLDSSSKNSSSNRPTANVAISGWSKAVR